MDGFTRCCGVRTLDEPIPEVPNVTNGNTRGQPRGHDTICQQPEEGFVFLQGTSRMAAEDLALLQEAVASSTPD